MTTAGSAEEPAHSERVRLAVVELERDGRLTPEAVLLAARDPKSPLHDCFEWDDKKAGHAFRIDQARVLIRAVRISVMVESNVLATPRYVRDPIAEKDEQGYVSLEQLRSEPENARAHIRHEFSRAATYLRRAEDLAAALGIRDEVRAVRRSIEKLQRRVEPSVTV